MPKPVIIHAVTTVFFLNYRFRFGPLLVITLYLVIPGYKVVNGLDL